MKKLFRYTMGNTELFAPADSEQEAYDQRAEVDHTFEWTPVVIEQVQVEGYTIVCVSDEELAAEEELLSDEEVEALASLPDARMIELPTDDEGQAELPMPTPKAKKRG